MIKLGYLILAVWVMLCLVLVTACGTDDGDGCGSDCKGCICNHVKGSATCSECRTHLSNVGVTCGDVPSACKDKCGC